MINLHWMRSLNLGDGINPLIFSYLSWNNGDTDVIKYKEADDKDLKFIGCGSILNTENINNSVIYGTGFANYSSCFYAKNTVVAGVRGNLTLQKIENYINWNRAANVKISNSVQVFEPCLALSRCIKKDVPATKKYKYGIIPHWVDYEYCANLFAGIDDILVIDLLQKEYESISDLTNRFIDNIIQCESIVSSSLHGLIISVSYNIPCYWAKFSDKILSDGFKYVDFISSIYDNRKSIIPIQISSHDFILDEENAIYNEKINIDKCIQNNPLKNYLF